jgi:hypothetical protein
MFHIENTMVKYKEGSQWTQCAHVQSLPTALHEITMLSTRHALAQTLPKSDHLV